MADDGSNGQSDTMVDFHRKGVAEAIEEHSKTKGNVPGYLQRWAKEHLKNKVDWRKELRSVCLSSIAMVASGMADYSRTRPSRRQASNRDFVLPGFVTPIPTVGLIFDTSGSMGSKHISQGMSEVMNVLKNCRASVIFVDVDAAVNHIGMVKDPKQIKLSGGGGTDLPVAYEALSKYKIKPNLVIALTDGYTGWPSAPIPHTKNVICIISPDEKSAEEVSKSCPPWAKIVQAIIDSK
jgi:predicted metal-dependent peptidase